MRLAISNIAWAPDHDEAVARVMRDAGVSGLEVAPTRGWNRPTDVTRDEALEYREKWAARGIEIVAMQALLYGRADLVVFGDSGQRRATLDYLARISRLAGWLGATNLVFGSPKNRRVDGVPLDEIRDSAVAFFREAGRTAAAEGVRLCIEPNPVEYECNFVTSAAEGLALVRDVGREGFGLHLDAGAMTLSGDDPARTFEECAESMYHFHVSELYLGPVGEGPVEHEAFATALRRADYGGWCSVEMRPSAPPRPVAEVGRALAFVRSVYGQ